MNTLKGIINNTKKYLMNSLDSPIKIKSKRGRKPKSKSVILDSLSEEHSEVSLNKHSSSNKKSTTEKENLQNFVTNVPEIVDESIEEQRDILSSIQHDQSRVKLEVVNLRKAYGQTRKVSHFLFLSLCCRQHTHSCMLLVSGNSH